MVPPISEQRTLRIQDAGGLPEGLRLTDPGCPWGLGKTCWVNSKPQCEADGMAHTCDLKTPTANSSLTGPAPHPSPASTSPSVTWGGDECKVYVKVKRGHGTMSTEWGAVFAIT